MLEDQTFTKRQAVVKQPGSCMQCHGSVYVPYKKLGNGDLEAGFRKMNAMPYMETRKLVEHPVACIDCHEPGTMALRVTRPGFINGIRELKAKQGVKDYDVNRQASQKEMRAFVCGQCHVEYYFKGDDKQLTYPWAKGIQVDDIVAYYDEVKFKDWVHKTTGAPALKAQHPEFEMWNQGIHGRSGVTCVDCHMPEIQYKGEKITDHQVNSPLLKVEASCTRCHADVKPDELKSRVAHRAGPLLQAAQPSDGRAHGAHRRSREGAGRGEGDRGAAHRRALPAAARPVLPRLRRGGELHRLPRAAGGAADPRRLDRLRAAGAARPARRGVPAHREDRGHPDGAARAEPGDRDGAARHRPACAGAEAAGDGALRRATEEPRSPGSGPGLRYSTPRYGVAGTTGTGSAWTLSTDSAPFTP